MTGLAIAGDLELAIGDLTETHRRHHREMLAELRAARRPPTMLRPSAQLVADATGAIGGGFTGSGVILYRVPQGFSAKVHRVATNAPGVTPLAPLAAGSLAWYWNSPIPGSNLAMMLPTNGTTAIAPVVVTDGSDAPWLSDGDALVVAGAGFAAGQVINVGLQVELMAASQPGIVGAL